MGHGEGKIEEVTSPKAKGKQHLIPMRSPTTRTSTMKKLKAQKEMMQDKTKLLPEKTKLLHEGT